MRGLRRTKPYWHGGPGPTPWSCLISLSLASPLRNFASENASPAQVDEPARAGRAGHVFLPARAAVLVLCQATAAASSSGQLTTHKETMCRHGYRTSRADPDESCDRCYQRAASEHRSPRSWIPVRQQAVAWLASRPSCPSGRGRPSRRWVSAISVWQANP